MLSRWPLASSTRCRRRSRPHLAFIPYRPASAPLARCASLGALALLLANCGSPPQTLSSRLDSKYGVAASPRVIEPGQPVPKGGGRDHLGSSYVVAGRVYTPRANPNYVGVGTASWYGDAFHGRLTANGEIFDKNSIAAAHPTLPLPSYVRVTNLINTRSIIVRVNDRGPYHGNRLIDVSQRVAEALDFSRYGTARVKVEFVGRAPLAGSDDRKLMATLQTGGAPASPSDGSPLPVLVASAEAPVRQSPRHAQPTVQAEPAEDEASIVPAVAEAPVARPLAAASLSPLSRKLQAEMVAARHAHGVPLPPQRPFELGALPRPHPAVSALEPSAAARGQRRERPLLAAATL